MNPYPMIVRMDGRRMPGVPASLLGPIMRAVRSVERRTQYLAWYNIERGSVIWLLGHDASRGGAHEEMVFQRGRYLPIEPDRTCRALRCAKMSWERKQREVEKSRRWHQQKLSEMAAWRAADILPEFRSRVKYLTRIMEDGPRSRPSVLVP